MITPSKEEAHKLAEQGSLLAQLNASEYVVVCLVFAVFPSRATPPNVSKRQLDQVISPRVVDLPRSQHQYPIFRLICTML